MLPIAALLAAAYADRAPEAREGPSPAAARVVMPFIGAASCSASACHGGAGPRGARFSEFSTWLAYDPHARAYETLETEKSTLMAQRLGLDSAQNAALCLACHVHPYYR